MSLRDVANSMREVATSNPFDQRKTPLCPVACYRDIPFRGLLLAAMFSLDLFPDGLDLFPGGQWAWHLSITPDGPLAEADLAEILEAFFGTAVVQQLPLPPLRGKLLEITESVKRMVPIPPGQRQFIQLL